MEDRFDKLDAKLDKMDSRLDSIDKTQVRHDENLKFHMQRSELLERQTQQLFSELKPIQAHVSHVNGAIKFIGIMATVGGLLAALLKIFSAF